jgi:putative restriction endonuclease
VKAFVAVTDNEWFRFLSSLPNLDEVNFWQPSGGRPFRVLSPGELLLFKLHHPEHFIAGGGFFAHWTSLPCSLAWESFGVKNGASTLEEMRARIERYRRIPPHPEEDYEIGCIILAEPFFFERESWIPAPEDFRRQIVQGKTYDLRPPHGSWLWEQVQFRLLAMKSGLDEELEPVMYGEPALVRRRLGQGSFRVLVTDTYERRCAVTQERVLPVLEAAHIKPVSAGGVHRVDNGLLLRSDFHTLFDRGYMTVPPDLQLRVSHRLGEDFANGEYYYRFNGAKVWVPPNPRDRPDREFLEWHSDTVFRR